MHIRCTIAGEEFGEDFADHIDLHVVAQTFGDRYSGKHWGDWQLYYAESGEQLDPGAMVRDLASPHVRAIRRRGHGG